MKAVRLSFSLLTWAISSILVGAGTYRNGRNTAWILRKHPLPPILFRFLRLPSQIPSRLSEFTRRRNLLDRIRTFARCIRALLVLLASSPVSRTAFLPSLNTNKCHSRLSQKSEYRCSRGTGSSSMSAGTSVTASLGGTDGSKLLSSVQWSARVTDVRN
jgi:hypothetical protein